MNRTSIPKWMKFISLSPNGTIDSSYATDGIASPQIPISGSTIEGQALKTRIQPDNKLLVFCEDEGGVSYRMMRLKPDGTVDSSYCSTTGFSSEFVSGIYGQYPHARIGIQSTGKVVVVGHERGVTGFYDVFFVFRYHSNLTFSTVEAMANAALVFPNPTFDDLMYNFEGKVESVIAYDVNGRPYIILFNENTINTEELPSGFYVLKLQSRKMIALMKFVKLQ